MIALLTAVYGDRHPSLPLFSAAGSPAVRARRLAALFAAGLDALRVPYGQRDGFVLSGLRAGGVTAYFQATQDLALTRWRGRWDSARSMEHYIQEAPCAAAYARLAPGVRARIAQLARLLPAVFANFRP